MLARFILSYYKKSPIKILFGFVMLILVDIAQLFIPRMGQKAIDLIASENQDISGLLWLSLITVALALSIGIFRFTWRMIIIGTSHFIENDFKNKIYHHLLNLDSNFYNKTKTGDIMAHMTNDMQAIRMSTAFGVISGFDAIFLFSATLIFMLNLNVKLTLFAMAPLPIISIITLFAMKLMFKYFKDVQESFSQLTDKVQEILSGIKIVQAFRQEEKERERFNVTSKDYVKKNINLIMLWGTMFPLIFLFADLGAAIVLYMGGQYAILGNITPGEFVAFFMYLGIITWPMMAIGWASNIFQRGNASFKRVHEFLKEEAKIIDAKDAKSRELNGDIDLRDITFSYQDKIVLKGLSMNIKSGEYVGIIGKIGTGKSTIAKLILRILEPTVGEIFFDGISYKKIRIDSVREAIGYVPQDSFLFSMSIMDNIKFGRREATDEEVQNVVKASAFYKDLIDFRHGLDTIVGEKGVTLSGGQKQRLCIARALIRKPKILILDDALSAVDTNTEKEILHNLIEFSKGITTIVISHRISSFMNADNIYVLEDERVESNGKHSDLILSSPLYREFYRIQKLEE
ncbi:MAG: multidrug ABC transporter ATP-binding protein [bacterium (Candidatus Stahlbacteria) CG23_combo_of_CG06-09_8_20_14_all_34_7]|nr:MAG: multidrug ABC transporter ATP-binding protein [bacterium (Candidatus Stahlbacteria) CG23_combo_of_CG06-09_8_20_14_all_34_7]